jgi:hypothetical protein
MTSAFVLGITGSPDHGHRPCLLSRCRLGPVE